MEDAFGELLALMDLVAYAGLDYRRKPTINLGEVQQLDPARGRVLILRQARSGRATRDDEMRRVWVDVSKVAKFEE